MCEKNVALEKQIVDAFKRTGKVTEVIKELRMDHYTLVKLVHDYKIDVCAITGRHLAAFCLPKSRKRRIPR